MTYLEARQAWIPNYRQRRIERQYIGSAHVEKANDLIVARRQKNRGMQWSEASATRSTEIMWNNVKDGRHGRNRSSP
jgi:hypothetical protein